MTNKRLNWRRKEICDQCHSFDVEREQERIAAQSRTNAKNKKNHLAHRYHQINKRRNQHDNLFHADIDALEREVNQFARRHRHILPQYFGWELKNPFERPSGPLAPGLERFYARANPNLVNGFDMI